jgi:cytochrome d ubiquinol oxidase subunit I
VWDLVISLTFFVAVYTVLAIIMVWLMARVIKAGPAEKITAGLPGEPDAVTQPAE